jgi:hypothetical protein
LHQHAFADAIVKSYRVSVDQTKAQSLEYRLVLGAATQLLHRVLKVLNHRAFGNLQ